MVEMRVIVIQTLLNTVLHVPMMGFVNVNHQVDVLYVQVVGTLERVVNVLNVQIILGL